MTRETEMHGAAQHHHADGPSASTEIKDPVCGMRVDPATAHWRYQHEGTTYYFCCDGCQKMFAADPSKYLGVANAQSQHPHSESSAAPAQPSQKAAHAPREKAPRGVYTCPMHPEVRSNAPGACPICGMALEPLLGTPSEESEEYFCPMDPEVVQEYSGACPTCGMALQPRLLSLTVEEKPDPELR